MHVGMLLLFDLFSELSFFKWVFLAIKNIKSVSYDNTPRSQWKPKYVCFVNFHLVLFFCATITKLWKWFLKIAFWFLLSLSSWYSKKKNVENYTEEKVRNSFPKNVKFHFCPVFRLANKCDFINNFIVRLKYVDDATPV